MIMCKCTNGVVSLSMNMVVKTSRWLRLVSAFVQLQRAEMATVLVQGTGGQGREGARRIQVTDSHKGEYIWRENW